MTTSLLLLTLLACGGANDPAQPVAVASSDGASSPKPVKAPEPVVRNVDVAGLSAMEPRPPVVDVRTAGEFASGHVPGAINIPLDEIGGRLAELEVYKEGDLAVICASGHRSAIARDTLAEAGFKPINVEGGTKAWIAAGLPVE